MKCQYCDNEVSAGTARCPACGAPVENNSTQMNIAEKVEDKTSTLNANMMFCPHCGTQINRKAIMCTKCGCAVNNESNDNHFTNDSAKSLITFQLLAFFFGPLGIHNFYIGRTGIAIAQLCITIFSALYFSPFVWIWAVSEIFTVRVDGNGIKMK